MIKAIKNKPFLFTSMLLLVVAIITVVQYKAGTQYIDSDMSAQMVYARLLNEEHSMVSENWIGSTVIEFLSECHLYKITLALFPDNWHAARVAAKPIALLILAAAFIYMGYGAGFKEASILGALVLICPFGYWQTFHLVFSPSYATPEFYILLIFGGILHVVNGSKGKYIHYILLISASLITGLMGPRVLLMHIAPILLSAFLVYYLKMRETKEIFLKESKELKLVIVSIIAAVINLAGYVINIAVLSAKFSFGDSTQYWKRFSIIDILDSLSDFLEDFGFAGTAYGRLEMMTLSGLITGAFGLMFAAGFLFMVGRLIARMKTLDSGNRFIVITGLFTVAICAVFFKLTDGVGGENGGYYIPIMCIVIANAVLEVLSEDYSFKYSKNIVATFLLCSVLLLSFVHTRLFIGNNYRHPRGIEQVSNVLLDNEAYEGYATFWSAPILTELSNGQIDTWTVEDLVTSGLVVRKWFQEKNHLIEKPEGKVFILTSTEDECANMISIDGMSDNLVYADEYNHMVFIFNDIDELQKYVPLAQ